MITDFTNQTDDLQWVIQNDSVMGGQSLGEIKLQPDHLYFYGSTNTRGGGFSSARSKPLELNLSGAKGIELDLKGDGRRYSWSLQTEATWRDRRISYWANFDTTSGERLTIQIPFTDFHPRFRGVKLDGPILDKSRITNVSLYIYDGNDGPFSIKLYSVRSY